MKRREFHYVSQSDLGQYNTNFCSWQLLTNCLGFKVVLDKFLKCITLFIEKYDIQIYPILFQGDANCSFSPHTNPL